MDILYKIFIDPFVQMGGAPDLGKGGAVGMFSTAALWGIGTGGPLSKIAVAASDGEQDILVWDLVNKTPFKLTSGPAIESYPIWTPDSLSVIFSSSPEDGKYDLFRRAVDGTDRRPEPGSPGHGRRPTGLGPEHPRSAVGAHAGRP